MLLLCLYSYIYQLAFGNGHVISLYKPTTMHSNLVVSLWCGMDKNNMAIVGGLGAQSKHSASDNQLANLYWLSHGFWKWSHH